MFEDDPKKRALIDAEKILAPCPLCGKSDTVRINADIIGFTMIECSCGLSVGPLHNVWEAVERYNNRAGEEKYIYELNMIKERLHAMYDDYSRLLDKYKNEVSENAGLIDKEKVQTEIALIAKHLAKSNAQKAIIGRILFMIDHMQTIEPEVRHGRWITKDSNTAKCSCCGWWQRTTMYYLPDDIAAFSKCYRFCTSCGKYMREDDTDA